MKRWPWLLVLCVGCTGTLGTTNLGDGSAAGGDVAQAGDHRTVGDTHVAGDPGQTAGDPTVATGMLSEQYPNDSWDLSNPAFIFTSDFESGLGTMEMESYTGDTHEVITDAGEANNGSNSLKLSFTLTGLQSRGDASIYANVRFPSPSGIYYVRYYMRYQDGTARPHHANGTRMYAPGCDVGGTAGIRPEGDERFNTTVDIDGQGRHFFYTYWHEMRSGRCNDGTAIPGCEGDQGTTYYYGNNLKPPNQTVIDRYQWRCYEYRLQANTPNQYDGELALWIDDALVGEFKTGVPMGAWLRDNFYTEGEWGTGDSQVPFEGFNFRTSLVVELVRVSFAIYQEWGTLNNNRDDTPNKAEEQAVFYDDIVIATERIGCRVGG